MVRTKQEKKHDRERLDNYIDLGTSCLSDTEKEEVIDML